MSARQLQCRGRLGRGDVRRPEAERDPAPAERAGQAAAGAQRDRAARGLGARDPQPDPVGDAAAADRDAVDRLVALEDQAVAADRPRAAAQAAARGRQRGRRERPAGGRRASRRARSPCGRPCAAARRRRAATSNDFGAPSTAGMPVGIRLHGDFGSDLPSMKRSIASREQVRGSLTVEWPVPGTTSRTEPGIRAATRAETSGGVRRSSPPWRIRVGAVGYGSGAAVEGGRGTSGQRRQRSISSPTTTGGSNGANVFGRQRADALLDDRRTLLDRRARVPRHRLGLADRRVAGGREVARRAEHVERARVADHARQQRAVALQRGAHGDRQDRAQRRDVVGHQHQVEQVQRRDRRPCASGRGRRRRARSSASRAAARRAGRGRRPGSC